MRKMGEGDVERTLFKLEVNTIFPSRDWIEISANGQNQCMK